MNRFFAVTSPILYSQHRHNTTPGFAAILACWAVSLAIGLPIMCGLNHRPEPEPLGSFNTRWTSDSPSQPLWIRFIYSAMLVLDCPIPPCRLQRSLSYALFTTLTSSSGAPWAPSTSPASSWWSSTTGYFRWLQSNYHWPDPQPQ